MVAVALPLRLRGAAAGVWFAGCNFSEGLLFWTFWRLDLRGEEGCEVAGGCGEGLSSAVIFLFRDEGGCDPGEVDGARLAVEDATTWSAAD